MGEFSSKITYYGQELGDYTHLGTDKDIMPVTPETIGEVETILQNRYGMFCDLFLYKAVETTAGV